MLYLKDHRYLEDIFKFIALSDFIHFNTIVVFKATLCVD